MDDNTSENSAVVKTVTIESLQQQVRRLATALLVVAVLLIASIAALGGYVHRTESLVRGEIEARPPIAILDVNGIVMDELSKDRRMSADQAATSAYKVGELLAEKGYVVIHKSSIVAYPAEFEVAQ